MKLIFFGSPLFAADILAYLIAHNLNVVAVVTQPPKPKGRSKTCISTPVARLAKEHKIPLFEPKRPSEVAKELQTLGADLFVVAAYGALLKEDLLQMPRLGCINVHTSLLPKYRGAAPIQRAIMEGESGTGVTIMHMAKGLDTGDIIRQRAVPIGSETTYGELEDELCRVGRELLVQVIQELKEGSAPRIQQDEKLATYAHKIERSDCRIDWSRPAGELHNLIRGVNPKPGAFCTVQIRGVPKELKILTSRVRQEGDLAIPCGEGFLSLLEVQLEGKKPMQIKDFLLGYSKQDLRF